MGGTHFDDGNPNSPDPVERFSSRPGAVVSCYSSISWTLFAPDKNMDELGSISSFEDRLFSVPNTTSPLIRRQYLYGLPVRISSWIRGFH